MNSYNQLPKNNKNNPPSILDDNLEFQKVVQKLKNAFTIREQSSLLKQEATEKGLPYILNK